MTTRTARELDFSANEDFDYEIRCALGRSSEGAAEPGEVLAAVSAVGPHDHDGWFRAWYELGERLATAADEAKRRGHLATASASSLRASAAYAVSVNAASAVTDSSELTSIFERQRAAWEAFVDLDADADRIEIPYEGSTLPGWFFRTTTPAGERAPAIVAVNGSDGSLASLWAAIVAPARRRGYHVLLFDGPGQQSQLFVEGTTFRPDWEHVLTPVFDVVSGMPTVDADRIAVYGISQGGYWVARALAFEHRFAAAITDPGVVDVSASWTSHLPKSLVKLLDAGETEKFDKEMAFGMRFSSETARTWQFRARPYGATGYAETIETVRTYSVEEIAESIATPLLILSPEGEQFWPGQADRLAELTPTVSSIVRFTAAEGADLHCQPLARTLTAQRVLDWLDDRLGP